MAYCKAKLKSNGNTAPPCFKPFLIGNMSDKCLPSCILLQVSFRYIFIRVISFMRIPDSVRILYKTSLVNESYAFLKSINSWCTVSVYCHFFWNIWQMQNVWSVVDPLHQNPSWWSPIISSVYGVHLDSRMLDTICTSLTQVICLCKYTYYSPFYHPSHRHLQLSTPFILRQFLLIRKRINNFMALRTNCSTKLN